MKQFINNVPSKIVNTFAIMINAFFIISKLKGIENIPVIRLGQLAFLAVMGGILIEVAFGTCLFKRMSDVKRITLFMVLFALITFGCAVWFQWITHLESIRTYISFIGIFFICWVFGIVLGEMEHVLKGKTYTKKLKEYQKRRKTNE